jgi:hypothetical protein
VRDCAPYASLPDYRQPINPTAISLAWRGGTRLDDTANPMPFSESEQSKNKAGGMVPLYAARVQDLKLGDVVVVECGACRHTAEIPPSVLPGLGLQPKAKVLDLERRLRCWLCDARGKAVVSVSWQARS